MTAPPPSEVTFVLCIENNAIREQAILLCQSIRRFTGRHRRAPIIAVAPRPGLGVGPDTRRQLEVLEVDYVELPLNLRCPEYGSANRVLAAAWVEPRVASPWIVVLDSDTVFLTEPELPIAADAAVRPVDSKGMTSEGPDDSFDDYWHRLAALHGVSADVLPFVRTTDGEHDVRASYNGGLVVVRRELGILQAWAALFERSIQEGLKPWRGSGLNVFASTGYVGEAASEYWGSNQAALALAIWGRTRRVHHYSDAYNVPLHLLAARPELMDRPRERPPVHVHYHWLFRAPHVPAAFEVLRRIGTGAEGLTWLEERLPLTWSQPLMPTPDPCPLIPDPCPPASCLVAPISYNGSR